MNLVEWAFGKRMTPAERLRKHQRALEKTQRELDRERVKLENQEKKLVADIKKSAKTGQMGPLRIQAKDLVRTRRHVWWIVYLRTQLILEQVYPEVLPDADTTTSNLVEDSGMHIVKSGMRQWLISTDGTKQRADDAVNEGRNKYNVPSTLLRYR
jgi:charged multivesicular body protein 2A